MNTDTFAYRLKTRREELNYSRKSLAEVSNIPENTIRNLENGETKYPRADTLLILSDILDISPQYLFFGVEKMNAYTNCIINEMENLSYDQIVKIKEKDISDISMPKLAIATATKEVRKRWKARHVFTVNVQKRYVRDVVQLYCQNRTYFKELFNLD